MRKVGGIGAVYTALAHIQVFRCFFNFFFVQHGMSEQRILYFQYRTVTNATCSVYFTSITF